MDLMQKLEIKNPYSDILNKSNNFSSISRKPFINFSNVESDLFTLTFPKTKIESWNYKTEIQNIFVNKLNESIDHKCTIKALEKDILDILDNCFNLSEDYSPREISLSFLKGTPCSKFHADFLPLRLVCTYIGPGTVYLPKESTRYSCLNNGSPNKRVVIKDRPVLQASPFEILILKGRKFGKLEMSPCAHKSPELINDKRLVLKIDFSQ